MIKTWKNSDYFVSSLIMLISFICFSIIACLVLHSAYLNTLDKSIIEHIHSISSVNPIVLPAFISNLGYGASIFLFLAIPVFLLTFYKHTVEASLITLITTTSPIVSTLSKLIFHRPRPDIEYRLMHVTQFSFPSGHAIMTMCFYGTIIYLIAKYVKNVWIKSISISFFALLIASIGFTRVYLCVHYPSDVMGGYMLGLFWVSFWILLYKVYTKKLSNS